jgi:hypothetical protein
MADMKSIPLAAAVCGFAPGMAATALAQQAGSEWVNLHQQVAEPCMRRALTIRKRSTARHTPRPGRRC